MYNTKFNMIDGLELYPEYLDQEGRMLGFIAEA